MSRLIDADEFIKKFRYTKANTEEEHTIDMEIEIVKRGGRDENKMSNM